MGLRFGHLSFEERKTISRMRDQRFSQSDIARHLGRDRSTISREIRRNYWHDNEFRDADGYWPMPANDIARDRRRRSGKLYRFEALRRDVIQRLKNGWTPEQIAGRLKIEPHAKATVCHETIYQYVYSPEGREEQLARFLPERRKKRRPVMLGNRKIRYFQKNDGSDTGPKKFKNARSSVTGSAT